MPTLKELQQQHPVGTMFRLPEYGAGFAIYFDGLEWLNHCGYPHCLDKRDALKHTWEVYQEPKKHELWVSWHTRDVGIIYGVTTHTRLGADIAASKTSDKRLACIKVKFNEGEGL